MKKRLLAIGLCAALAGCSSAIVPKAQIKLFPNYGIAIADIVTIAGIGAVVYYITDPMAPTWKITETRLADNRVMYELNMQTLHLGGEGEARYIMTRRAEALVREQNMRGYQILRYEESIDSRPLFPHRMALAEIQLTGGGTPATPFTPPQVQSAPLASPPEAAQSGPPGSIVQ
jgi:hypothetical protein